MSGYEAVPLDESLYSLDPRLARLFKQSTGIWDEDQLKAHILKVQAEAYAAYPYPCIRLFSFTQLAVTEYSLYNDIIRHGRTQPEALLLEIGVGFGNDIRKMVADGYPIHKIVLTDISAPLWDIGHRLFCSSARTFPVKFIQADIFDHNALSPHVPPPPIRPDIRYIQTLTPLKGYATTITLQMVFHLWDLKLQIQLARRIAALLSPIRGSVVVGRQMGDKHARTLMISKKPHYLHNPESWERMWAVVFPPGSVEYRTSLIDLPPRLQAASAGMLGVTQFLTWSIRRL
ncbi:hypothetical protein BU17DRAFT_46301 [Hysterangium stoloniferum]|nr:hypothetical protein BU17DRAFT_46301 [Hysterangium stoloniferum]